MDLSLSETATVLGKSERQVRYLLQQGKTTTTKKDGRWFIESASLPLQDAQRRKLTENGGALQAAVRWTEAAPWWSRLIADR